MDDIEPAFEKAIDTIHWKKAMDPLDASHTWDFVPLRDS